MSVTCSTVNADFDELFRISNFRIFLRQFGTFILEIFTLGSIFRHFHTPKLKNLEILKTFPVFLRVTTHRAITNFDQFCLLIRNKGPKEVNSVVKGDYRAFEELLSYIGPLYHRPYDICNRNWDLIGT